MIHAHYWPIVPVLMAEYVMGRQNRINAKSIIEFVLLLLLALFLYIKWIYKQGD